MLTRTFTARKHQYSYCPTDRRFAGQTYSLDKVNKARAAQSTRRTRLNDATKLNSLFFVMRSRIGNRIFYRMQYSRKKQNDQYHKLRIYVENDIAAS